MKVLVTGSSGHLGEALVRTMRDSATTVVGLDTKPSDYTTAVGSIVDADFVRQAMSGVDVIYHAATLHKPHVATHSKQDFINTNVSGTLALLEAAVDCAITAFVFTSTTSLYGDALKPSPGEPAVWVTEDVNPIPKNIYGVTKTAAEDLCHLFHRKSGLNCIILRTSRFFPEEDDDPVTRSRFIDRNVKANEMLFRRVDIEDVVSAHLLASKHAAAIGFGRYIISATTPFLPEDLPDLSRNAAKVIEMRVPGFTASYRREQWRMFDAVGRVYVNEAARRDLRWKPKYDFAHVLNSLRRGDDFMSPLAKLIGSKGYHDQTFEEGLYPVE